MKISRLTIAGGAGTIIVGASITLMHLQPSAQKVNANDEGTATSITTTSGVSENPPEVKVNGETVPPGTSEIDTGNGKATVTVSGNSANVQTENSGDSSTPGNLNISVTSNNSSTGTTSNSYSSSINTSATNFSSNQNSSSVWVSGNSNSSVQVTNH